MLTKKYISESFTMKYIKLISYILIIFLITFHVSCQSIGFREIPLEILNKKYANYPSKYLKVNKISVHYRDQGHGPTILALHGIFDSLHCWDGWVEELSDKYRIIRFDLPGFGLTGGESMDDFSIDSYVEFINYFVESLDIKRFHVVGNSLGAHISWNYAVSYPNKVEKLILLDPPTYNEGSPWPVKMARAPIINLLMKRFSPRFIVAKNVRSVLGNQSKLSDEMIDRYFEMLLRPGNRSAFVKFCKTFKFYSENVTKISVPLLLMWGDKDTWAHPTDLKLWKKDLPKAKIIVYKGVGHIPQVEIPQQTAKDAHQFLQN